MSDDTWQDFQEYQLLIRVLSEQSKVDENNNTIPKDKGEITSTSLQNPSDPDTTYRRKSRKSNKGYVGNLIETVGENGDSLITGAGYEQNVHSDSEFCKEYLNSCPNRDKCNGKVQRKNYAVYVSASMVQRAKYHIIA